MRVSDGVMQERRACTALHTGERCGALAHICVHACVRVWSNETQNWSPPAAAGGRPASAQRRLSGGEALQPTTGGMAEAS